MYSRREAARLISARAEHEITEATLRNDWEDGLVCVSGGGYDQEALDQGARIAGIRAMGTSLQTLRRVVNHVVERSGVPYREGKAVAKVVTLDVKALDDAYRWKGFSPLHAQQRARSLEQHAHLPAGVEPVLDRDACEFLERQRAIESGRVPEDGERNPLMELQERAAELRRDDPKLDVSAAQARVLREDTSLYERLREHQLKAEPVEAVEKAAEPVPAVFGELSARVAEVKRSQPGLSETGAMAMVFKLDPAFYERYRQSQLERSR